MAVITVSDAGKDFGDITILEHITFEVQPGQRVGLVGANGTGKTTLIKLLTSEYETDFGSVYIPPSVKIGVLDQIPKFNDDSTVEDVLRTAFYELDDMRRRMTKLEELMAESGSGSADSNAVNSTTINRAAVREYGEISSAYELAGGYNTDVELKRIANGLGISHMLSNRFGNLSGGERTRINLGRLILMNVDLLLLDEPTNHLDIESVEWLEEFLNAYKGTVLLISHDRYFLDKTISHIIEIENLTATVYEGNYSKYVFLKEEALRAAEAKFIQDEKKIKQLEFTARRLHGMGTEKQHKRAFSMEKRIEWIRRDQPKITRQGKNIRASFGDARRPGNDILNITGLSKGFGDRVLFSDVELEVKKDDRIALVGPNGSGKTTLLKILQGEENPDSGRLRWGVGVKLAYLPQLVHFKNERTSVLDCLMTEIKVSPDTARNLLGRFKFSGEDVYKFVPELSGGERSRLKLCVLMYEGVNMLILDEPTNHLDIRSREWIEEAIDEFEGTLLLVSHDRYFVTKLATKIWSVEDGGITDFDGNYEEFRLYTDRIKELKRLEAADKAQEQALQRKAGDGEPRRDAIKKRSREHDAIRKQLTVLERDIERQELVVSSFAGEIEKASSDHIRLSELMEERDGEEQKLDDMMTRWAEMAAALEEAGE